MTIGQVAAVDLGATSGRVVLATVGTDSAGKDVLELDVAARFPNEPLRLWNGTRAVLHTDVPGLFGYVRGGLADAARRSTNLVSIAVDSWAVDYGLLREGTLLGLPHHYRDERTARGVELVESVVDRAELFARNGLQFLPFTTVYQLAVDRADGVLDLADRALLVPDLIGYWLTGKEVTERTNASTTGLFGTDGTLDTVILDRLGLAQTLFADLAEPGSVLGRVLPGIVDGDPAATVTTVGSHDTASAVAAVPMDPDTSAYISCGTWGLVGVETRTPIIDERVRAAGFTNEAGVDGRTRLLHNVMGLWLLSESVREWTGQDGTAVDLPELVDAAAQCPPTTHIFEADDDCFLSRGDMPARIARWYAERGLPVPATRVETVRAIVDSLAAALARSVRDAAAVSGVDVRRVHVVGGGAQNTLLCRSLADELGLPVLAGPVEATAIGNVLVQARTHDLIDGDLQRLRHTVASAFPPIRHEPSPRHGSRTA
ncbi:rhamnulokinase family protein [Rhodococcus sp. G-MC3]|uniref:rhamnulokinase n=1 Tax=Rhodococcus sp. G-MC3 TaxID=3046209 RepID=UPI0024BB1450|nr:rhamnulokinase family protein [Rhodococcus sp. G-MC3]MDJ0395803.1 rhamnulokinase family protein [Rhodococcus sp. G-MC3]